MFDFYTFLFCKEKKKAILEIPFFFDKHVLRTGFVGGRFDNILDYTIKCFLWLFIYTVVLVIWLIGSGDHTSLILNHLLSILEQSKGIFYYPIIAILTIFKFDIAAPFILYSYQHSILKLIIFYTFELINFKFFYITHYFNTVMFNYIFLFIIFCLVVSKVVILYFKSILFYTTLCLVLKVMLINFKSYFLVLISYILYIINFKFFNIYILFDIENTYWLEQILFNLFTIIYEFIFIHNALKIALVLLALFINYTKLMKMFSKFLAHEKSKKLFFMVYVIAVWYIIPHSILVISSFCYTSSVEGIILLYVYMTATLMLFLIFLALTTCESYLNKDRDTNTSDSVIGWGNFFLKKIIYVCPIIYIYFIFIYDMTTSYILKYKVINTHNNDNGNLVLQLNYKSTKNSKNDFYINHIIKPNKQKYSFIYDVTKNKNILNIFDSLKHELRDTYFGYFLSAILQASTLILIIITLIV